MSTGPIYVSLAVCLFLGGGLEAGAAASAEKHDFAGLKSLKLLETPHYRLYYKGKSPSKNRVIIEKVWEEGARLLPRIVSIFNKGDLNADISDAPAVGRPVAAARPGKRMAAGKKREPASTFKLNLVFVEDRYDYEACARTLIPKGLAEETRLQAETVLKGTPTFVNLDRTTRVFWSGDPNLQDRGYDIFVSHCNATDLIEINQRDSDVPFWLAAGFGYYMEFCFFKKSVTSYLDYEKYYDDIYEKAGRGKLDPKDSLAIGKPWAPILKRLMGQGKKGDLGNVLTASSSNLTPERCGYIYALVNFLVKDAESVSGFRKLLNRFEEDGTEDQMGLLVKTYGYEAPGAMQEAWHKYILGSEFR